MKILLTVHCFYPKHIFGTETYTLEIARTLKTMGHEVYVLTTNSHTEPANGQDYVRYIFDSVPVISLDTTKSPNRHFIDTYYQESHDPVIKEIIQEIKPDIIHCVHTINLTVSFLKIVRELDIPAMITLTDFFGICFNCKLQRYDNSFCTGPDLVAANCVECYFAISNTLKELRMKSGFVGKIVGSSKALVYLSKLLPLKSLPVFKEIADVTERKSIIQKQYEGFLKLVAPTNFLQKMYIKNGYPERKVNKLTFGLNREPFKGYTVPREKFSRKLTFGYIGQLYWHKGVDILIEAFNNMDNKEILLKIYGDPKQDENYTLKLKELIGDNANIKLLGTFPREILGKTLRDIDVLVIPSLWYENAPLVLLGALATRTPVIVSDVDGMNEFIKHDYNGFLFTPGDVMDLSKQLRKCIDEPEILIRISKNANYEKSIKENVEEYLAIYQECIQK